MNIETNNFSIDPNNLKSYSAGLLQGIAFRILHEELTKTLRKFNLSVPEWKILGLLYDKGQMSMDVLSLKLGVEPPLTTKFIRELERKELIIKALNYQDKRGRIISISSKGKFLIDNTDLPIKHSMGNLLKGITHEELINYLKVLTIIVNNSAKKSQINNLKGGE